MQRGVAGFGSLGKSKSLTWRGENLLEVGRVVGVEGAVVEGEGTVDLEVEGEGEGEAGGEEVEGCAPGAWGGGGIVELGGLPKYPDSTSSSKRTCISSEANRSRPLNSSPFHMKVEPHSSSGRL